MRLREKEEVSVLMRDGVDDCPGSRVSRDRLSLGFPIWLLASSKDDDVDFRDSNTTRMSLFVHFANQDDDREMFRDNSRTSHLLILTDGR